MDVKLYMNDDLKYIENLVGDLYNNITIWPSEKVLEKTSAMFGAFHKRFALEDFLLIHVKQTVAMQETVKGFLQKRTNFRENLENMLMLHVDEPDFRAAIGKVREAVSKHLLYLKEEFDPAFVDRISQSDMAGMSTDLEEKLRIQSFS
jgi:hypothetical protein